MKNEIKEEIDKIAPGLIKIGNRNPFITPDLYFDHLELDINSKLDSIEQKVPENYFVNLPDEIIAKAKAEKPARVIALNMKQWLVAASIAVMCIASYFTLNSNNSLDENHSFAQDIELEEAFDYLTDNDDVLLSEVLELDLIEVFEEIEEDFDDLELDSMLDELALDDLNDLL